MAATEQQWEQGPGLLASVWRYKYFVAAVAVVVAVATYWLSVGQSPTYEAQASLVLVNPGTESVFEGSPRFIDPVQYVPRRTQQMTSRPVLERASALLDNEISADALERRVSAEADVELETITVTASASTAESAAAVANAVVSAYQSVVQERAQDDAEAAIAELEEVRSSLQEQVSELEAQIAEEAGAQVGDPNSPETVAGEQANLVLSSRLEALNAQLLDLQSRAQQLAVNATVNGSGVDYVELARAPDQPASPQPFRDAALAFVLALGLASAFAYWLAGRNEQIQSRSAPERILGAPLLGEIPVYTTSRSGGLAERLALPIAAAEAYEFVLSSLEFALGAVNGSSVVISSAAPEDGKTSTAVQLAVAATRNGRQAVLVDADLRIRGLSKLLEASKKPGLTELVTRRASLGQVMQRYRVSDGANLPVVPAGLMAQDSTVLLRSPDVGRVFGEIAEDSGMVIVDSPPLLAATDASVLASHLDGIVLVVNAGTPVEHLRRVRERLEFTSTPLLGYVYNRSNTAVVTYYDYGLNGRPQRRPRILGKSAQGSPADRRPIGASSGQGSMSRSVETRRSR